MVFSLNIILMFIFFILTQFEPYIFKGSYCTSIFNFGSFSSLYLKNVYFGPIFFRMDYLGPFILFFISFLKDKNGHFLKIKDQSKVKLKAQ